MTQVVCTLVTIFIAWRALKYNRDLHTEMKNDNSVERNANTISTIAEFMEKFNRVFSSLKEQSDKFLEHDKDCIKDKVRLAEQINHNTDNIATLTRTVSNLERRMGYMARDGSIIETRQKLTGDKI